MKKVIYLFAICLASLVVFNSCNNDDDGPETVPLRDRTEEATAAQLEIEEYLETHFYNYEDFENPSAEFDFKIVFDTIAGENANKIPLIEQVSSKMVRDRLEEGLMYKLYFLKVIQGGGESPNFPDIVNNTYEGRLLDNTLFDSSTIPVRFDLTNVINGYQDIAKEFNGASNIIQNPDGSLDFEDFGVGAMFIPSGLGYFGSGQGSIIEPYDQLIFTFQLYTVEAGDQDNDGILSINEDLNNNGLEEDDDTDEDGLPNYFDNDDDNDGILTSDEIEIDDDGNITFPDADGDGTPDYLDSDS
ncbi:FKBP-type peptidyl-prolyl cis-trans isomerase [Patiriisocius hiemis]|uniref:peptidylprolyl isomerase n=1 Tax=Patiriisocius hiemis TaxID=3075604 RepID=A0ABU2YC24_9FLAO|nr:hypothetical protein [Constantimarinum sp. W242]MDT0555723.1 hypothetical protein [Constantimarinum sp. W242]